MDFFNVMFIVNTCKTNSFVSTVTRNRGNCNLIGHVGCYDYTCTYTNYSPIIKL